LPDGREDRSVGDPMEAALLSAGRKAGLAQEDLRDRYPELREEAFSRETKMMATFHREGEGDGVLVAVKGAPEAVLSCCATVRGARGVRPLEEADRNAWRKRNEEMAAEGLRVLGVAEKSTPGAQDDPYEGLTLLGLAGLLDPPRENVGEAVASCRRAGIRVVMVTGDQAPTALAVARAVGLPGAEEEGKGEALSGRDAKETDRVPEGDRKRALEAAVFARVDPKQKLDLIRLHQENGSVVAMTGDGVNDAPALKKADIGIAMGKRGTQVAREAADIVLQDDEFSTIVAAVGLGRVTFGNIRKFVLYLLSCNVSEILAVAAAMLAGLPLPLLPLQILFLNLVTDVFPALALGAGEGQPGIMRKPPRPPGEPILTRAHWVEVGSYGAVICVSVLASLVLALRWLGMDEESAVTISFLTLAFAQLWHVFNMRERDSGILRNEITRNPWVWGALLLCAGLLLSAVYLPPLSRVLRVVDPGPAGWAVVAALSPVPLALGAAGKLAVKGRDGGPKPPAGPD
ncbi:MAG TPA: HAD-IC family P-type ATPase, partial [Candidatus Aquicultoraceae bacterium]|nr:HAD-IC family P-type ATPase [Candidatus Aquicultoraceae bacterium]